MAEPITHPETLDLSLMAHVVLNYHRAATVNDGDDNYSQGYETGQGRAALRLWQALTGLPEAEALEYATQVASQGATAAVVPF